MSNFDRYSPTEKSPLLFQDNLGYYKLFFDLPFSLHLLTKTLLVGILVYRLYQIFPLKLRLLAQSVNHTEPENLYYELQAFIAFTRRKRELKKGVITP